MSNRPGSVGNAACKRHAFSERTLVRRGDRLAARCGACIREAKARWRARNAAHVRAYAASYREANRERVREWDAAWIARNRERRRRQWRRAAAKARRVAAAARAGDGRTEVAA